MCHPKQRLAYFHLPGLFEFYDFYQVFLPLFQNHRDYFYDWCRIGSIYGAPSDCIWGGGRIENADCDPLSVMHSMHTYDLSARLTFSNSLLRPEHLSDKKCNALCRILEKYGAQKHGVIVHSDLLLHYLMEHYPGLYFVSSTTKVLLDFDRLWQELDRPEFRFVVPDFRLNQRLEDWRSLTDTQKDKVEFLCNECCWFGCKEREACYREVSHRALGQSGTGHRCTAPGAEKGYRFSAAMKNPGFISLQDIVHDYMPMGFSNFKIEGRGLGSALLLEFILYYMTKPECQLTVREEIYLSNTLDLF